MVMHCGVSVAGSRPVARHALLQGPWQPTFPIGLRHELYDHPAAPVIRTILSLYDRALHPLKVESGVVVE
jgi:hypothetical protein